MTGERERQAAAVGYWRTVELFSPQKVPVVSSRERVYEVAADHALPWEAGHPVRSFPLEPGYAWQHIVYGGCFALADVRDTLLEAFGRDEEDVDGRMDGDSALFVLTVTDDGRLLLDGAWQIQTLQAAALDAGLLLMPAIHAWRPALVAADVLIGAVRSGA